MLISANVGHYCSTNNNCSSFIDYFYSLLQGKQWWLLIPEISLVKEVYPSINTVAIGLLNSECNDLKYEYKF